MRFDKGDLWWPWVIKSCWRFYLIKIWRKTYKKAAGRSSGVVLKLGREEDVTTTILSKICKALNCDIGDIMAMVNKNKVQ